MPDDSDLSIIVFRLNAVEAKLDETASLTLEKLNQLLGNQADLATSIATERQARQFLASEVKRIEDDLKSHKTLVHQRHDEQQRQNTDFQVTLAQKVLPGAITGGLTSIILMLVKFMTGAG